MKAGGGGVRERERAEQTTRVREKSNGRRCLRVCANHAWPVLLQTGPSLPHPLGPPALELETPGSRSAHSPGNRGTREWTQKGVRAACRPPRRTPRTTPGKASFLRAPFDFFLGGRSIENKPESFGTRREETTGDKRQEARVSLRKSENGNNVTARSFSVTLFPCSLCPGRARLHCFHLLHLELLHCFQHVIFLHSISHFKRGMIELDTFFLEEMK